MKTRKGSIIQAIASKCFNVWYGNKCTKLHQNMGLGTNKSWNQIMWQIALKYDAFSLTMMVKSTRECFWKRGKWRLKSLIRLHSQQLRDEISFFLLLSKAILLIFYKSKFCSTFLLQYLIYNMTNWLKTFKLLNIGEKVSNESVLTLLRCTRWWPALPVLCIDVPRCSVWHQQS